VRGRGTKGRVKGGLRGWGKVAIWKVGSLKVDLIGK